MEGVDAGAQLQGDRREALEVTQVTCPSGKTLRVTAVLMEPQQGDTGVMLKA